MEALIQLVITIVIFFVIIGVVKQYLQQNAIGRIVLQVLAQFFQVVSMIIQILFRGVLGLLDAATAKQSGNTGTKGGRFSSLFGGFGHFLSNLFSGFSGRTITNTWNTKPQYFSSEEALFATIGWAAEGGQKVEFQLSDTPAHAFIGGIAGSGKSNLIHVLIHGMLDHFPPSELNLYLVDCKQGVEFNVYVVNAVPQVKFISVNSNVESVISVLEYLTDELKRRGTEFRAKGVGGLKEYRKLNQSMPRILLLIDEFQVLFEDSRENAEKATRLLTSLFRQGRSFGIHILLATQSLMGLGEFVHKFQSQLGCRIALNCTVDDSRLILSESNTAAQDLINTKTHKEAILNKQNGASSANIKFTVPYADPHLCVDHLRNIATAMNAMGFAHDTKVFDGEQLPKMPSPQQFRSIIRSPLQICLGDEYDFEAKPFTFQWERRKGNNLCVTGIDETIRQGILYSVLSSVSQGNNFDRIIYYNSDRNARIPNFSNFPKVMVKPASWNCDITDVVSEIGTKRTLLIIDTLDNADNFLPELVYGSLQTNPGTPADSLKMLLEKGTQSGSFVLAFADNWKRLRNVADIYLSNFALYVGFCLNGEDAGGLITGGYGNTVNGLEESTKAVFVNRLRSENKKFRPFVIS